MGVLAGQCFCAVTWTATGELAVLHIRALASVLLGEHKGLECAPSFS